MYSYWDLLDFTARLCDSAHSSLRLLRLLLGSSPRPFPSAETLPGPHGHDLVLLVVLLVRLVKLLVRFVEFIVDHLVDLDRSAFVPLGHFVCSWNLSRDVLASTPLSLWDIHQGLASVHINGNYQPSPMGAVEVITAPWDIEGRQTVLTISM